MRLGSYPLAQVHIMTWYISNCDFMILQLNVSKIKYSLQSFSFFCHYRPYMKCSVVLSQPFSDVWNEHICISAGSRFKKTTTINRTIWCDSFLLKTLFASFLHWTQIISWPSRPSESNVRLKGIFVIQHATCEGTFILKWGLIWCREEDRQTFGRS